MKIEDFTFVIVCFKSEDTIFNCLGNLPKDSKKIIIENSNNLNLKLSLESKYQNLECYLMNENVGYGKGNNFGAKKTSTKYVFILNPDVRLNGNTLENLIRIMKDEKFSIAAPYDKNQKKINFGGNKFLEVGELKGFAMIIKTADLIENPFDENFFLYLEEIDLCERFKKKGGRLLLINEPVDHLGGFSHGNRDDLEMEISRNWHWMWSKFYYNRKNYGYLISFVINLPTLINSYLKLIFYKIKKNKSKYLIYQVRFNGLLSSYLLKNSFYRPYKK